MLPAAATAARSPFICHQTQRVAGVALDGSIIRVGARGGDEAPLVAVTAVSCSSTLCDHIQCKPALHYAAASSVWTHIASTRATGKRERRVGRSVLAV